MQSMKTSKQLNAHRTAIQAEQLRKLNDLLSLLQQTNPFYKPKIAASGLQMPIGSVQDFMRFFPFTTKAELELDQQRHPPFGTNLTYPVAKYSRFSQTSGSIGKPLRWLDTPESWEWMVDNWIEVFAAANVQAGDRVFFAFSFGPFLGFWVAFDAAKKLGCLCIPGGGMNSVTRLHAILESRAEVLCCTPTYALHLAAVAKAEKIDLNQSPVRAIIAAGEPGASIPATRQRLEALWPGARVYDHYGMTEIGPVSYECPEHRGVLHILESEFIAEVIDPDSGQPGSGGETGELVLTNLGRLASPLLRYRTGDIVAPGAASPCACGSHSLALEGGILGRSDDMVQIRGVNVYLGAIEQILRGFPEVVEYRVEVSRANDMNEITIQVEPAKDIVDTVGLSARIEKDLRLNLSLRIPVVLVPVDSLPRFEMKAKRWVNAEK
jgi:phenylacetate-CoA ligase